MFRTGLRADMHVGLHPLPRVHGARGSHRRHVLPRAMVGWRWAPGGWTLPHLVVPIQPVVRLRGLHALISLRRRRRWRSVPLLGWWWLAVTELRLLLGQEVGGVPGRHCPRLQLWWGCLARGRLPWRWLMLLVRIVWRAKHTDWRMCWNRCSWWHG